MTSYKQVSFLIGVLLLFVSSAMQLIAQEEKTTIPNDTLKNKRTELDFGCFVIDSSAFNKGFIINIEDLILGKISDISITSNSGKLWDQSSVYNGSPSSFYGYNKPIIVIDGIVIIDKQIFINPNDISKITIVDEAVAVAKYGAEAASGAIEVETKKGTQKLRVDYNSKIGMSYLPKQVDVFSGDEYRNQIIDRYSHIPDRINSLGASNTNWQDLIYQKGMQFHNSVSVRGTAYKLPYYLSIGRTSIDGILKTSGFKRNSFNLNLSPSFLNNSLNFRFNLIGLLSKTNEASEKALRSAVIEDPTFDENEIRVNPVSLLNDYDQQIETNRWLGSISFDYRPSFFKSLKLGVNISRESFKDFNQIIIDTLIQPSRSKENRDNTISKTHSNFFANYTKYFAALSSSIDITIGVSKNKESYRTDFALISTPLSGEGYNSIKRNFNSKYLSAKYLFKSRYQLIANYRVDNDSRFDLKKNIVSWSGIASWKISNEPFLINSSFITNLQLNFSYSILGNTIKIPSDQDVIFFSENLKNEQFKTKKWSVDYGFWNDRVFGAISGYTRTVDNTEVLFSIPLSTSKNILCLGQLESNGLKFSANVKILNQKDRKWVVGVNINKSTTKINYLGDGIESIAINSNSFFSNYQMVQKVGEPLSTFLVYQQVYDSNGKPIEGLFVDRSGEGGVAYGNYNNLYSTKSIYPKYTMGINSSLNYRNWYFNLSGRLVLGNYVYNDFSANSYWDNIYGSNITKMVYDHNFNDKWGLSDYFVQKGSFFRMDFISLGYTFKKLTRNLIDLSIAVNVQNAFVITKYKGFDPEQYNGVDSYTYPRSRTISLELNLSF